MNRETRAVCRWVIAVLTVASSACVGEPPDAGRLETVFAPPAEDIRIYSLARNQTLGGLLNRVLSANEQASLLMAFREHASPRSLRTNTEITLRYLPQGDWLRGVDIAISPDQTIRLDRDAFGWHSGLIQTPIFVDTLYASGEIETSLWWSVIRNPTLSGIPHADRSELIAGLDRVFQWQLDFSRQIRVGDTYRFAFEREVRPDGTMRAGRLLAAEFVNSGTPYHAIYFDPNGDGQGSYYDLEGESVRRAFLLKPLEYRRISGRFVQSRYHPVLNTWRAHRGIDYAADAGTPVMATADGVVIHRGWKGSFGNAVEIRHNNGFVTRYAHLRAFKAGVVVGTRVTQSDIVGYVGMTGLATGTHLHYEMLQRNGQHMDPLSVDLPPGDPVPADDRRRWRSEAAVRVSLLESIPRAGPVRTALADEDQDPQSEQGEDENPSGGAQ